MKIINNNAFSLVELLISLVVISCVLAAMTPVVTKKLSNRTITVGQNLSSSSTNSKVQDINTVLNVLKDCRLNESKTGLICEIELSQLDDNDDKEDNNKFNNDDTNIAITPQEDSVNVRYSERRDKIRFDNRESGGYKTSTVVKKQADSVVKKISIPIENEKFIIDETFEY